MELKPVFLGKVILLASMAVLPVLAEVNPIIEAALEQPGTDVPPEIKGEKKKRKKKVDSESSFGEVAVASFSAQAMSADDTSGNVTTELALSRIGVKEDVTAETTELFGEQIDLSSGGISLSNTDLSIPGNFPIDVGVTRVYRGTHYAESQLVQFGDWQLAIPAITTTVIGDGTPLNNTWTNGKACSGPLNPGSVNYYDYGYVVAKQYWSGDFINVPGVGTERLLEPATATTGVTRVAKNWKIQCFTDASSGQEGFKATSPQGVTYTFNKLRLVRAEDTEISAYDPETASNWVFPVARYNAFMQVTEVRDRFNNYVTYNYGSADQLDSIVASDGRSISFTYELGTERKRVKSITANGKTWQYFYRKSPTAKWVNGYAVYPDQLHRVVLPDSREWIYDIEFAPTAVLKARHTKYSYGGSQQDDIQCSFSPTGGTSLLPALSVVLRIRMD